MLEGYGFLWLCSASSRAYCFLEHALGAIDEDLGCARDGGCGVYFVSAVSWLGSEKGQGRFLACFTGALWV